jgi:hypothetical protein
VVSASSTSATSVLVTFDRNILPASVNADGSQFTLSADLAPAATAAAVSGKTVTLTTAPQTAAASYTVTVAATVTDMLGTGVDATARSTTFSGFGGVTPFPAHGDFETWNSPTEPASWTLGSMVTADRESTIVHKLAATRPADQDRRHELSNTEIRPHFSPVVAGTTFKISYWVYDKRPERQSERRHQWYDASQAEPGRRHVWSAYSADGEAWQEMTATPTAPPTAASWRVSLPVYGSIGGVCYLDDVSVVAQ